MSSNRSVELRYVPVIICMIIGYMMVVQGVFAWLLWFQRGDSFLLFNNFRNPYSNWSVLPVKSLLVPLALILVPVVCIVGIAKRKMWAWWLALAAVLYELVSYSVPFLRNFSLSAHGAVGLFKLAWLLVFLVLLFASRRPAA